MIRENINRINNLILIFILLTSFSSCIGTDKDEELISSEQKELEFELDFGSRAYDADELEDFSEYFVEGVSSVLISQRTTSLSLNFKEDSNNCYKYTYHQNDNANWESGYNFSSENPLDWDIITSNGQYSNGFAFGALFFPRDYDYTEEVKADQSNMDDFYESDILGAWHRTSVPGDRLRFRLYHLMSKLQIKLYIPVWKDDLGTGFNLDDVKATALSFRTDYSIEWGDRITELPPLARPSNYTEAEIPSKDIIMHQNDGPTRMKLTSLSKFNVIDIDEDDVNMYEFDMFLPPQDVTPRNILRFVLTQGSTAHNYVMHSSNLIQDETPFAFVGGEITQLELYLSRTEQEVLVMNVYKKKWGEAKADFTITPDSNKNSDNSVENNPDDASENNQDND